MTGRTANNDLRPSDVVDISPEDADRLRLCDGQLVRIRSRYGAATLPLRVSAAMNQGQLFATFQTPGIFLNAVTGSYRDTIVGTPEYKVTAVQVVPLNDTAVDDEASTPGTFPGGFSMRPEG
jgi:formate dehydrogenase major subunit